MADNLVMEEREESMVSPNGGHECFRTGHFLTPSVTSIDGPVAAPTVDSINPVSKYKDLPFKVNFLGWKYPRENWKRWVDQMYSLHKSTWKRAGILDAIMNSKCTIHRHDDLILGFVQKWCATTNSFVFPWGEATVTLEDMIILGGYSVLGELVLSPPGDTKMEEKELQSARSTISKTTARKALQSRWITKFMGSNSEIEHEAFLAYWLSKFVFPLSKDTIGRNILPIAVRLARGTKIALAPAVLACIYKNLTLLKAALTAARKSGIKKGENHVLEVTVSAPLALVQVWIWERFPLLHPKANSIGPKEPRLARWDNVKKLDIVGMFQKIDSAGESFKWHLYVSNGTVYMDEEYWASVDSELDEDLEGFVRCLRASELVSLETDCIQHYLPHRVAMQFGLDQDLPGHVARINVNPEIAWRDYCRPIKDTKLYVPAHSSKPHVTTQYLKWWKKLNLGWRGVTQPEADGMSSRFEVSEAEENKNLFSWKLEEEFVPPSPGFSQRQSPLSSTSNNGGCKNSKRKSFESSPDYEAPVSPPPGFVPNHCQVKACDSGLRIKDTESSGGCGYNQSKDDDAAQGKIHLSCTINNENTQEKMLLVEPAESEAKGIVGMKISASPSEVQSSRSAEPGIGLEQRIKNVEKLCAWIKAGKLICLRRNIQTSPTND